MDKIFGLDRVLEPTGVFPPVAWKIDNDSRLRKGEARVTLELIHLEWDSFQQICSSCGYEDDKIKAKIIDIVEKRGKLQNPFTGSGGVFLGTVAEISDEFAPEIRFDVGDRIYCIASLGGIPIHIDEIYDVDYDYGQITCSGYAIVFEASPVFRMEKGFAPNYTMAAIDEAGSIFGSYNIALEHDCRNVVIIGRNIHTTLLYAASLREAIGPQYKVMAIMDKYFSEDIPRDEIEKVMEPLVKETFFADLSKPIESYHEILGKIDGSVPIDLVIITEDISGSETLGILLVKPFGFAYFTSFENNYSKAVLCAESMGKIITTYAFDQYVQDYPVFTTQILHALKLKLEEIDKLYKAYEGKNKVTKSRARSFQIKNAGKEDDFVYQDIVTRSMIKEVMNIAKYDCNVIIQGETGVGKEKVLSLIHQNSARRTCPCIKINCATIQETLAESEFFGYEAGAFTGAQSGGKEGYFELANEGILFLDEIGTLSMNMQSKLLRVLQENQFYRVGGTRQISVNVRVVCANNVPLRKLVDEGKFREDLYYRLNICTIEVPPLRERRADILIMAETFVKKWNKKYNIEKELSPEALNVLYDYYWPGNVRELENVVHRLVISSSDVVITDEEVEDILNENAYGDLINSVKKTFNRNEHLDFHQLMEQQEKQIIEYALKKEGTTRKAAELLRLPQTTFARKKLKYKL
jgi:transcriptional regulator with PAS, ATPase and Fis domain